MSLQDKVLLGVTLTDLHYDPHAWSVHHASEFSFRNAAPQCRGGLGILMIQTSHAIAS